MALLPQLTRHLGQPLFLPAHGRGAALPDGLRQLLRRRAGVWDLPELPALGGPLEADGAIADSQRSAAAAMGVARCWYGVNGATGLLQAALLAMVRPGERVLLPRNVHRSLIQALRSWGPAAGAVRSPLSKRPGPAGTGGFGLDRTGASGPAPRWSTHPCCRSGASHLPGLCQ